MANNTGRAIVKAVRGTLGLVSSSSELLNGSQLLAVKSELRQTLAIVKGQLHFMKSGSNFIDISDWESADEEEEPSGEDGSAVGTAGHTGKSEPPLEIPGPYPMSPPDMEELPDCWYVVDCGTEVGIFMDNASSTRAVTGVTGGHQTKVKTWHEAATLYNTLYSKGNIVRTRV